MNMTNAELSEEAHAQNKSNFYWDLMIKRSTWPLHHSPSNNDSNLWHKIREKHNKLLSSTGRTGDVTVPENNVELLKKCCENHINDSVQCILVYKRSPPPAVQGGHCPGNREKVRENEKGLK